MPKSKLDEFIRLFHEKRTWHVEEIANRMGVSRQSVYRYRDRLWEQRGIMLEGHFRDTDGKLFRDDNVKDGYLRWPNGQPLEEDVSFILSKAELEALRTAVVQMQHLTPLLQGALEKLGKNNTIKKELLAEPLIHNPQIDNYDSELFEKVSKAIRQRRVAKLSYQNAKGEEKTYRFNAYRLISSDNHLHLVGVSHNSLEAGYDTVIRLRLDMITSFEFFYDQDKSVSFAKPDFDVESYATREFGPFSAEGEPSSIKVIFSQEKAGYIARTKRHPSQTVSIQADGTALWQIEAPISQDLVYWIVSYGPHAKVVEPEVLRKQVTDWAKGSLDANS